MVCQMLLTRQVHRCSAGRGADAQFTPVILSTHTPSALGCFTQRPGWLHTPPPPRSSRWLTNSGFKSLKPRSPPSLKLLVQFLESQPKARAPAHILTPLPQATHQQRQALLLGDQSKILTLCRIGQLTEESRTLGLQPQVKEQADKAASPQHSGAQTLCSGRFWNNIEKYLGFNVNWWLEEKVSYGVAQIPGVSFEGKNKWLKGKQNDDWLYHSQKILLFLYFPNFLYNVIFLNIKGLNEIYFMEHFQ